MLHSFKLCTSLYTVGQILFSAIPLQTNGNQWMYKSFISLENTDTWQFFKNPSKGLWGCLNVAEQNLACKMVNFKGFFSKHGSTSSCCILFIVNICFQWDLKVGYFVMQKCVDFYSRRFGHGPFIPNITYAQSSRLHMYKKGQLNIQRQTSCNDFRAMKYHKTNCRQNAMRC